MKSLEEFLDEPYLLEVVWSQPEDGTPGWVASMYELDGCQAQGDTIEELQTNIRRALMAWIGACLDDGLPIPEPGDESEARLAYADLAPVLLIENRPNLAARYGDLLQALVGHPARSRLPAPVTV